MTLHRYFPPLFWIIRLCSSWRICLASCLLLLLWFWPSNCGPNLSTWLLAFCRERDRRRQWHPTPVLLPGKSHGRRSLVGCRPWGRWGSDTTERLHFHFSLSCTGEGNGNPLQCSCLENPRDRGAWWAAVYGVAQSDTTEVTQQQQQQRKRYHYPQTGYRKHFTTTFTEGGVIPNIWCVFFITLLARPVTSSGQAGAGSWTWDWVFLKKEMTTQAVATYKHKFIILKRAWGS